MKNDLLESEKNCLEDISFLEKDFMEKFNLRISAIFKEIIKIDNEEWKEIKHNYFEQKEKIFILMGLIE